MFEEQFLRDLQRDMNTLAHDTLMKTTDHDQFLLAAGMYRGMQRASALLQKLVRGNEE